MFNWDEFFNDFAHTQGGISVPYFNQKEHIYTLQNYLLEQGMLVEDVDYAIKTLLGEAPSKPDPQVAKQAKQMGLVFLGFGNWGKKKGGPATHKNVDGKLVTVGDEEPEDDKEKKGDDKEKGGEEKPEDDDKPINLAKGDKVDAQLGGDRDAGTMDMMDKDDVGKIKQDTEEEKPESTPVEKKFQKQAVQNHKKHIEVIDKIAEAEEDPGRKKALEVLTKEWNDFINAETEEQRVQAVENLIEYNLIERNQWSEKSNGKIYVSNNAVGVPYKQLNSAKTGNGDAVTNEMNRVIRANGLDVNMRNNSADRSLADLSGKHNEAGVVALLDPSEENSKNYNENRKKYKELNNSDRTAHKQNKKAAKLIKKSLPKGSTITSATQIGGMGRDALMKNYGIDDKVDPTDLIVEYEDAEGKPQVMKISAKIYSDPSNITMKNSGMKSAGVTYLGEEIGNVIDGKLQSLREENNYMEDGISAEEASKRKRKFREEYSKLFGKGMEDLANTPEGENKLVKMWKDIHGCGHDVHTLIVNKKTGKSKLHAPDHYCNPTPPFKIKYDGGKVMINLESSGEDFVQIDVKTEQKSSPKLLFKHRVKK